MQFIHIATLLCLTLPILSAPLPPTMPRLPTTAPSTYDTISKSHTSPSPPSHSRIKHYMLRIFTAPTSYANDRSTSRRPCADSQGGSGGRIGDERKGWSSKLADNVIPWELEAASQIDDNELPEQAQSRPPKLLNIEISDLGRLSSHRLGIFIPNTVARAGVVGGAEGVEKEDTRTVTRYTTTFRTKTKQGSLLHGSLLEYVLMVLAGCIVAAGLFELWNLCRGKKRSRKEDEDQNLEKGNGNVVEDENEILVGINEKTAGYVAGAFRGRDYGERELPPYTENGGVESEEIKS